MPLWSGEGLTLYSKRYESTFSEEVFKVRLENYKTRLRDSSSARPQRKKSARTERLFMNLIFKYFSKICRNPSFIKIWQEWRVLYMKTNINGWTYLAEFFLQWKMYHRKVVEKTQTHISSSIYIYIYIYIFKSSRLWDVKKMVEPERPQWQHSACAFHAGYRRIQTHVQNTKYCFYSFYTATMVTRKRLNVTFTLTVSVLYSQ